MNATPPATNGSAKDPIYDVFIIGGGINGCGIARDAVGRGYSVGLCEKNDLASGTSSWSTKLIHGGLRYLEHYEFRLVRESLIERETLWRNAPHIIWPLRFVLPHHKGLRPAWLLRLGLFLYDHLGGRKLLPPTATLNLRTHPAGAPLKAQFEKGFEYSDCWVQDARLTVLNARDAADRGADVFVRTECARLERRDGLWEIGIKDAATGETRTERARLVVNAAGPWVDRLLRQAKGENAAHNVRLVQGSHIVTKKLYDHDRCYIFQNADGRIFFTIPYEEDFTLIGTTDRDFDGDLDAFEISEEETDYLLASIGEYLDKPVTRDDIVWTYSGVRPLYDDGASAAQEATRDYVLKEDGGPDEATLINIFGGKITTYRRLAEGVVAKIEGRLGLRQPAWTAEAPLPGGDFPIDGADRLAQSLKQAHEGLPPGMIDRLVRHYGTATRAILKDAKTPEDLGRHFGADLYAAEVRHLMDREWARDAEDVLWRRTKLGLRLSAEETKALADWMGARTRIEA
ncbi:MAG: glycerol-3-phosphate dehydrogenase [Alphaproteobacteria bacterium]|nr:glycerol-3-phosphate dehydrogenase [Alphaproteobacteria bacterium]